MDPIDLIIRAVLFIAVLYAGWFAIRALRWLWRTITGVRVTEVARVAGAASAKVEQKAGSIAEAFKAGRNQSRH